MLFQQSAMAYGELESDVVAQQAAPVEAKPARRLPPVQT